jgi:hypothetical protein
MPYDPARHHRKSIRLQTHDYAGGGTYFITICAHREAGNVFGNAAAKGILARIWEEIALEAQGGAGEGAKKGAACNSEKGAGARPARGADTRPARTGVPCVRPSFLGAPCVRPFSESRPSLESRPFSESRSAALPAYCIMPDHFHGLIRLKKGGKALGDFICAFKSRTTLAYIQGVKAGTFPRFKDKIWHRNYYEMIVRSAEAEAKIANYIRMNPWRCVQALGDGLRGMGNPSLWQADKMGVLCSRNATVRAGLACALPNAAVYLSGFHSQMEQEILAKLLALKKPVIWCPAWGLGAKLSAPMIEALEENRMLVLEMRNHEGNLAAAEQRNQFVIDHAAALFTPHITPGGMLDRLLKKQSNLPNKEQQNEK